MWSIMLCATRDLQRKAVSAFSRNPPFEAVDVILFSSLLSSCVCFISQRPDWTQMPDLNCCKKKKIRKVICHQTHGFQSKKMCSISSSSRYQSLETFLSVAYAPEFQNEAHERELINKLWLMWVIKAGEYFESTAESFWLDMVVCQWNWGRYILTQINIQFFLTTTQSEFSLKNCPRYLMKANQWQTFCPYCPATSPCDPSRSGGLPMQQN